MPTFSVITANFNSGEKLAGTAASVRDQGADAEYVIVDGASTDGSIDVARRLERDDPERVRLISEPDRGVYDAMNKGVRAARGRYIYFLGAGDRLLDGVLNEVGRLLPPHDHGLVYGDVLWLGERYDGPFDWRKLCVRNICHQAIFYGRDVFRVCGAYNLRYKCHADWEMNLRCFGSDAVPERYVPIVVSHFEAGGISAAGDPAFEKDRYRLIRRNMGLVRYGQVMWSRVNGGLARRGRRLAGRLFEAGGTRNPS